MSVVRTPPQLNRIFRFGEFEFSVRAGELHRNGEVVRLQYQPLRVLLVLLEYSGEVVTREEIRQRVWPDESLQDFDNSLRVAVAKLRSAFNDDADNPRYIETLPRRGYRWLYPVTVHDNQRNVVEPDPIETASPEGVTPQGLTPTTSTGTISPKPSRRTILMKAIFVSVVLWLAVSAAVWYLHPQSGTSDPSVRPLTTYPGLEYMPALSPDGKRVAFAWTGPNASDPYVVYVKEIGEDRAQRVTDTPPGAGDSDPVWMPDGSSILFFRRFGQDSGIYLVSMSGGNARQLQATSLHGCPIRRARFDISPDGKTIVYPDRINGQPQIALFLLDLESMKSHQLTFPPPESEGDRDPVFSHDGRVIAFDRDMLDSRQVYVAPVAGGDVRLLTDHNRADIDGLTWTHDDQQVLLGGQQLRRISASKSPQTPAAVPYLPGPVLYPFLRGSRLAYSQAWDNANIWKLSLRDPNRADGAPTMLISSTRQEAAASFSPDGSQIAFQSDRSGAWEIWKSARGGSSAVQLTHFDGPLTGTPRWSPDGRQIAFDSRPDGKPEIYLIAADGGTPRQATNGPTGSVVPAWSRDGNWLYYSSNRDGVTNIWKMPVDGGAEQRVTSNGGIYAAESFDGRYVYYSRSQIDPTLWRIAIASGVEQLVEGAPKPFGCSHWALGASGIYIIDQNGDLNFYDVVNRHTNKVIHHPGLLTDWSLAVSPDEREVVWAQVDARTSDLMLVENFR